MGDGMTRPRYCTLNGVAKLPSSDFPCLVLNELVCTDLATVLGLPVPPGVVVEAEQGPAYVSLQFGETGERPPPIIPATFAADNADLAAAVVVFDLWIGNEDRHDEGLAYSPGLIPPAVFDHSHAIYKNLQPTSALEYRGGMDLLDGCLVDVISDSAALVHWVVSIERAQDDVIFRICTRAARNARLPPSTGTTAASFLIKRKGMVRGILKRNRARMTSLDQQGML